MATEPYALPTLDGVPPLAGGQVGSRESGAGDRLAELEAAARERGYEDGLAQGREQLETACRALAEAAAGQEEAGKALVESLERRAAELALLIAEKILATTLELAPESVRSVVAGALRRVAEADRVVVTLNPEDLETVRAAGDDLAGLLSSSCRLELVGDRRVERGGCIVSTSTGEIDARIREQLDRAREVVAEALAGGSAADV